jgi:uncharacterized protein involved in exopolysaccharide biosynthesis
MLDWTPIYALAGALFGGSGIKFLEKWLNKEKDEQEIATQIRNELRGDMKELKIEVQRLEQEVETWKQKYYDLLDQFWKFKQEHNELDRLVRESRDQPK